MEEALEEAGLWHMKEHIHRRQSTIVEYIENISIYELCLGAERISGLIIFMRWWDQEIKSEEEGQFQRGRG